MAHSYRDLLTEQIQTAVDNLRVAYTPEGGVVPEEAEEIIKEVLLTFLDEHVKYYAVRVPAYSDEMFITVMQTFNDADIKQVVLDGDEFESVEKIT